MSNCCRGYQQLQYGSKWLDLWFVSLPGEWPDTNPRLNSSHGTAERAIMKANSLCFMGEAVLVGGCHCVGVCSVLLFCDPFQCLVSTRRVGHTYSSSKTERPPTVNWTTFLWGLQITVLKSSGTLPTSTYERWKKEFSFRSFWRFSWLVWSRFGCLAAEGIPRFHSKRLTAYFTYDVDAIEQEENPYSVECVWHLYSTVARSHTIVRQCIWISETVVPLHELVLPNHNRERPLGVHFFSVRRLRVVLILGKRW